MRGSLLDFGGRVVYRHFLVSVLLPYLFMMLIGVGLLLITMISSALHAVRPRLRELGGALFSAVPLPVPEL